MLVTGYENDCVGCPQGCISCGRKKYALVLEALVCDRCKQECDELLAVDDEDICADCLVNSYELITADNFEKYME